MALTTVDFPMPMHYSKRIIKNYPGATNKPSPSRKGPVHKNTKASRKP